LCFSPGKSEIVPVRPLGKPPLLQIAPDRRGLEILHKLAVSYVALHAGPDWPGLKPSNARRVRVDHVVRQVDEQLGEAPLGRGVVAEHRREGGIPERFWQALSEGLSGSGVIAQPVLGVSAAIPPDTFQARGK